MTLAAIHEQITYYKESANLDKYNQIVNLLATYADSVQALSPDESVLANNILVEYAYIECFWALIIGELLWRCGFRTHDDFSNNWNVARFCGISNRFSRINTAEHFEIAQQFKATHPSPAAFILLGNSLRELKRYSIAEDAYLEGIYLFPDDPFLKFRLVDLYLLTYKLSQAYQILNNMKPLYPYALEMMFIIPTEPKISIPSDLLPSLSSGDKDMVCFVAADPIYMDKYANNFAKSVLNCAGESIHFHFHIVCDSGSEISPNIYAELNNIIENPTFTVRKYNLVDASQNWRKALFASERFLMLAEILKKYQKPVLVTDIDVECLKDPKALLTILENGDFGYTNFRNTLEAWERYAATVMIVKPTEAAIAFFNNMNVLLISIINNHPRPWFVDQIALFRLIEESPYSARSILLKNILTDTIPPSPQGFFRTLHGSWENVPI